MRGQGRTGVVPVTLFLGAAGAGAGVWVFVACPTALTDTWVPALLHTEHKKQILHQLTLAALGHLLQIAHMHPKMPGFRQHTPCIHAWKSLRNSVLRLDMSLETHLKALEAVVLVMHAGASGQ